MMDVADGPLPALGDPVERLFLHATRATRAARLAVRMARAAEDAPAAAAAAAARLRRDGRGTVSGVVRFWRECVLTPWRRDEFCDHYFAAFPPWLRLAVECTINEVLLACTAAGVAPAVGTAATTAVGTAATAATAPSPPEPDPPPPPPPPLAPRDAPPVVNVLLGTRFTAVASGPTRAVPDASFSPVATPAAPAAPASPAAPATPAHGWIRVVQPNGSVYFHHEASGVTSWDPPVTTGDRQVLSPEPPPPPPPPLSPATFSTERHPASAALLALDLEHETRSSELEARLGRGWSGKQRRRESWLAMSERTVGELADDGGGRRPTSNANASEHNSGRASTLKLRSQPARRTPQPKSAPSWVMDNHKAAAPFAGVAKGAVMLKRRARAVRQDHRLSDMLTTGHIPRAFGTSAAAAAAQPSSRNASDSRSARATKVRAAAAGRGGGGLQSMASRQRAPAAAAATAPASASNVPSAGLRAAADSAGGFAFRALNKQVPEALTERERARLAGRRLRAQMASDTSQHRVIGGLLAEEEAFSSERVYLQTERRGRNKRGTIRLSNLGALGR